MKTPFVIIATSGLIVSCLSQAALAQQTQAAPAESVNAPAMPAAPAPVAAPVAAPAYPAAQVQLPGALPGTTAADQNGDGVVDGYYTSDGLYQPFVAPVVQPVRSVSRRGERG